MGMAVRDVTPVDYSGPAPVLLAASSDRALTKARSTLEHSGLRVAATLPIEDAADRLHEQASLSALWIELDDESDCAALDDLLEEAARGAGDGRYSVIVAAQSAMLDPLFAAVGEQPVDILIDAGETERTAALAVALSRRARPARLSDVAADRSTEQLRKLSEEVNRIATMLAPACGESSRLSRKVPPASGSARPDELTA